MDAGKHEWHGDMFDKYAEIGKDRQNESSMRNNFRGGDGGDIAWNDP